MSVRRAPIAGDPEMMRKPRFELRQPLKVGATAVFGLA